MATLPAFNPKHSGDELAMGFALAVALHAIPVIFLVLRLRHPMPDHSADAEVVSKPVIAASLLKLGKPIDPNKLPDRLVPQKATAPKQDIVTSPNEPTHKNPTDAGPPPPNVQNSDLATLVTKSDLFAEDAGVRRPEQGFAEGSEAGTETDPSKVHAGDMYAAGLAKWFKDRWTIPSVISQAQANRLCTTYQVNISPRMVIWHMRPDPIRGSGNDLFDDSARTMLQKLLDDRTALPDPPPEVADQYKGRTVNIQLGDGCK